MNYTANAWKGANYNSSLSLKDINGIIRNYLKTHYKDCKFSVTKHYNTINIRLVSAPFNPFATPDPNKARGKDLTWGIDDFMARWNNVITKGHFGVNHYYIDDSAFLSDKAKAMFKDITKFVNGYNYDDSDAMVDYFDTNFYLNLSIGDWSKPFIKTN